MGPGKKRIIFTRLIALPLIFIQLFTAHTWRNDGLLDLILEDTGVIMIGIAMLGRGWSSLFISGHKTHDLIVVGPYSIVRNPLYVFSFIGALGIGFCSENIILLTVIILLFVFYYPAVIDAEEVRLKEIHGKNFSMYCERVPRLLPNFALYSCPESYEIDTRRVLRTLRDCLAFLAVFPVLELIEHMRSIGYLPTFTTLPGNLVSAIETLFWRFS